jgi:hypothetical protein
MKDQLPKFILAELFSKSLVITGDSLPHKFVHNNAAKSEKWFLGNYEKKIIVLINDRDNVYIDEGNLEFLSVMLAACKLNLAHIALINLNQHNLTFSKLKKEMNVQYLILFGVTALQIELPFTMPAYQVQAYDSCSILIAPALQTLNEKSNEGKGEKGKLWKSLQKMFDLK